MSIRWLTVFLDFPEPAFDRGVAFWAEITRTRLSPFRGADGEFATLVPEAGDAYLRVQRTRQGGAGCHLDLHVDEPLVTAADRAVSLGARIVHALDDVIVLASPGGFAFCVVPWDGEAVVPAPVRLDDGGASRVYVLCLDIPPDEYHRECEFWTALTGWPLRDLSVPGFAFLDGPGGQPVWLLLQRRDEVAPGDRVMGHLDIAAEDAPGLADRHTAAGARVTGSFEHWLTMADPTGQAYCLVRRDPVTLTRS